LKTGNFGFPWTSNTQAVPGAGGDHHRWDAPAASADHDAVSPDPALYPEMSRRISANGGKISCSVCHDQHDGATITGGGTDGYGGSGTPHLSAVAVVVANSGGGTVTPSLAVTGSTPSQKSYTIKIVAAGTAGPSGPPSFQVSFDNGLSYQSTQVASTTSAMALNGDANVKVAFSGYFTMTAAWSFYFSYPMLRYPNRVSGNGSQLCKACHPARFQSAVRARGEDPSYVPDGTRYFSHPVAEALGNNAYKTNDRGAGCSGAAACQNAILDPGGANQAPSTPASQLVALDSNGNVHCMSCHYPHNADSSSLSVNAR